MNDVAKQIALWLPFGMLLPGWTGSLLSAEDPAMASPTYRKNQAADIMTRETDPQRMFRDDGAPRSGRRGERPAEVEVTWPRREIERNWRYVLLHHSAAPAGDVDSIDQEHRQRTDRQGRHWLGIGYHFVVGNGRGMADGLVEPTFRWIEQLHGAHAGDTEHNEQGIGVCLIGDFEQQAPTSKQIEATGQLIAKLRTRYAIPRSHVLRHRDIKATECPGRQMPFELFSQGGTARAEELSRRHSRDGRERGETFPRRH